MLAMYLLRLYSGVSLYETRGRIGTPGLWLSGRSVWCHVAQPNKALPSLHSFCNCCCTIQPHVSNEPKGRANNPNSQGKDKPHWPVNNLVLQLYAINISFVWFVHSVAASHRTTL